MNLGSTVNRVGKVVTQIIHFKSGHIRTFGGCLPETIKDGRFVKIMRNNGSMLMVREVEVECIEVWPEDIT